MALELRGYRPRVPSAPDSLVAQPLEQAVRLEWSQELEDASVEGYRAFLAETEEGSYALVASVAAPPAVVEGLTNGQTYWFQVAACAQGEVLGERAGPVPCAPQSGGLPVQAEAAWQPQSLSAVLSSIWGVSRPMLRWYPRLAGTARACYNIYRSQGSSGPFALVGARTQPGTLAVMWMDYGTRLLHGDLYYEVTYYDGASGFESWPSSAAHVRLP